MEHRSAPSDPRPTNSEVATGCLSSDVGGKTSSEKKTSVTGSVVTPGDTISEPGEKPPLLCGVDTLDLGVQTLWPDAIWKDLSERLAAGKAAAGNTQGIRFHDETLILPKGRQGYAWHLQSPDLHLYIADRQFPYAETPNLYVSPQCRLIWERGLSATADFVTRKIQELGGIVRSIKPSRADLSADFEIPGGLDLPFLLSLRVPADLQYGSHGQGIELETFYHGSGKSPLRLRIYNKTKELLKHKDKPWFFELWNVSQETEVWRFEFQVRREALKEFQVETVDDLQSRLAGIWTYLTEKTFSLRLLDNENTSRRTVHNLWKSVQNCAPRFGEVLEVSRVRFHQLPETEWYVPHIAGCLTGYAARKGIGSLTEALTALEIDLRDHFHERDFREEVATKSIQAGLPPLLGLED